MMNSLFRALATTTLLSSLVLAAPNPGNILERATSTVKATATPVCPDVSPIAKSGDFENNFPTQVQPPWFILSNLEYQPVYTGSFSYGVGSYATKFFFIEDQNYSGRIELVLAQNVTVCPGRDYHFAFNWFMTDCGGSSLKYKTLQVFANDVPMMSSDVLSGCISGPYAWAKADTGFSAHSSTVTLKFKFVKDYGVRPIASRWGIDNVAVYPY